MAPPVGDNCDQSCKDRKKGSAHLKGALRVRMADLPFSTLQKNPNKKVVAITDP